MNKAAPSFGRIAAMVVFALSCFGLLLFLWLAFGGAVPLKPKGYRFTSSFSEATQLSTEADVRISGVPVGKVKTIEPDKSTGRSIVVIELDSKYAPLPSDARAILRQKTLLGETYVELTPGSRDASPVPEGGSLKTTQVADTVQLDEIFRTFDKDTRAAFQTWMQEQARGIGGYGRDLNDALGNLAPFAEDAARLVDILNTYPFPGKLRAWERDHLVVQTLQVLSGVYTSPYRRQIDYPLRPDTPEPERTAMVQVLANLPATGIPDTIAYLSEDEVLQALPGLEALGFPKTELQELVRGQLPPDIDYYRFSLVA